MVGIDPKTLVHEIKYYLNAKPIRQCLHLVHPKTDTAIKVKVENILCVGFIYPVS